MFRSQRGEELAVGLTDGLNVGLGTGVIDAPGLGTIGLGVAIGVGEMPGELFRIGWSVGSGLVPGIGWPFGLVVGGMVVPPGLVMPGWVFPGLVLVCPERNDSAAMHATTMPSSLI